MIKKAEQFADEDKKKKESIETRNQAESFSYQLEKTMTDLGDKVPADVKSKVQGKIDEVKTALNGTDDELIKTKFDELQKVAQEIGQVLYQQQGGAQGPQGPQGGFPGADPNAGAQAGPQDDGDVVDAEFKKA